MRPEYAFHSEDRGNCRVYYGSRNDRAQRLLYCIQDDGTPSSPRLAFYRCSKDGEPDYEVAAPDASQFDRLVLPTAGAEFGSSAESRRP